MILHMRFVSPKDFGTITCANFMSEIQQLIERLRAFRKARDWDQFHNPKDLAIAIVGETAELLEHFQWKSKEEVEEYVKSHRGEIGEEVADVFIYLLQFCDRVGIDLAEAARMKIEKNDAKYPAGRAVGSAKKYTHYQAED
jgi:NTP pyrophosphatase (non-canonical NTP hydrolase)